MDMIEFDGVKSSILGFSAQQRPEVVSAFNKLFCRQSFARIIELGSGAGGLTVFLGLYGYTSDCEVYTFDSKNWMPLPTYKLLTFLGVRVYIQPRFHRSRFYRSRSARIPIESGDPRKAGDVPRDVLRDPVTTAYVAGLIGGAGRTLLLCDNGNKNREFNLYAPYLKHGDIIMAHDYVASGKEDRWKASEVNIDLIRDTIAEYNLQDYMRYVFEDVAWLCQKRG